MMMIDTPGHNCFTTMRYVGTLVSNMVIIVIDINKGVEKETIECLKFVRKYHGTNFLIALSKLDKMYGWKTSEIRPCSLKLALDNNMHLSSEIKSKVDKIICDLAMHEINACMYDNNKDIKTFVSMVPMSANTGEGVSDLIILISKMIERSTKELLEKPIAQY